MNAIRTLEAIWQQMETQCRFSANGHNRYVPVAASMRRLAAENSHAKRDNALTFLIRQAAFILRDLTQYLSGQVYKTLLRE